MKKLFKEVGGLRVECLISSGKGDPIFIFHGNSSCAAAYESLLNSELGKQHQLIAISFPGHGESSYYTDAHAMVSIAMLGQFTAEIVQQFDSQRYLLVGQSLGGHALLESLHLHPKAAGLCLVSAPPFSLNTIGDVFREDPTDGLLFSNQLNETEVERFADAFMHNNNPMAKTLLKHHVRITHGLFRENLGKSLAQGLLEDELTALAASNIPTLLLQGKQDRFINNSYYDSLLQQQLPLELRAFDNCGHAIQLDAPQVFHSAISDFIHQHFSVNDSAQNYQREKDVQHA